MSAAVSKDPKPENTAYAADIRAERRRARSLPPTDRVLSDYEILLFQGNLPRRTMGFMGLPLELRIMIYKECIGQDFTIWSTTLRNGQSRLRIGGATLLRLSKAINQEVKHILFGQNFHLTGNFAAFVMDSFLHTIGNDSLQHLRHITTTVPFSLPDFAFRYARSDSCRRGLHRVYENIQKTCRFRIPRSSFGRWNENCHDVMVKSFRATCGRLAKSNLEKLDLLLPFDENWIQRTPTGLDYRWGNGTLISLIVHNLRPANGFRANAFFWTALEKLGEAKPDLTISLILVHSGGQNWSRLTPDEAHQWRRQAEWVLCRGKSLGWKIGYATNLGKGYRDFQVKYDPDIMEGKFGEEWMLPDPKRPAEDSIPQS